MRIDQATVGRRVKSLIAFCDVPEGTHGIIDEDYGTGVMVAWNLLDHPLPTDYKEYDGESMIKTRILRDGFDKQTELGCLTIVNKRRSSWRKNSRIR